MTDRPAWSLRFANRRRDGLYDVTDPAGSPVAAIHRHGFGYGFRAITPDGSGLCGGQRARMFSNQMELLNGDGEAIGRLQRRRRRYEVNVEDGRNLELASRWFGQGWVLTDEGGTEVLSGVRNAAAGRTREQLETGRLPSGTPSITVTGHRFFLPHSGVEAPKDWLVTTDGSLQLAQTVAIVEIYRIILHRIEQSRNINS